MMKTVRVSEKGQIAIPQSIRKVMGIQQGDDLVIFELDGKLLLQKTKTAEKKMRDDYKDILKFSEKSLKEVWDNKEDEIWSHYLE